MLEDLTLYWYTNKFTRLPDWKNVLTSKVLSQRGKSEKIRINIMETSYQIDVNDETGGLTQILAPQLPIKLMEKAVEIKLEIGKNYSNESYKIYILPFDINVIDNYLRTENCLFYNQNGDNWTVIKWEEIEDKMKFKTMLAMEDEGVIVMSESM